MRIGTVRFWWVVGAVGFGLCLPAVRAQATEAAFSWVRLDGAEECASAPQMAKLIEARIGRPVLHPPSRADVSIEGRVGPDPGGGWLAVVDVSDNEGRRLGRRELRVRDEPCAALDRPASLIISLFIDPNAAGPGLLQGRELSADAAHLLAQLDLPDADPDEVLTLLVSFPGRPVAPAQVPALTGEARAPATSRPRARTDSAPMVSVPASEWRRLRDLEAAQPIASGGASRTPAWPGYALLGASALSVGLTIYAVTRVQALNDDPLAERYGQALFLSGSQSNDYCIDARAGRTFGLSPETPGRVADVCDAGELFSVLQFVFAGTALLSGAAGAVWLIWIADDDDAGDADDHRAAAPAAALSLAPSIGQHGAGLRLRFGL